jgi:hypothetical protein
MNTNILAVLIQEGSRMASEYLENRGPGAIQSSEANLERFLEESNLRLSKYTQAPEPEVTEVKPVKSAPATQIVNVNVTESAPAEGNAMSIEAGCVPCAMGHFGTCSGILNESIRFAHGKDGLASPEVVDRIGMCMDELNAMERVDLRPEMTYQLTGKEKELAERALTESRTIRHALEGVRDIRSLEEVAAHTQTARKDIGRQWFQNKMNTFTPDDKAEIQRRVLAKIEEMASEGVA